MRKHLSMRRRNNKKRSFRKRVIKKTKRNIKRNYRKRKTRRKRGGNAGDIGDTTTSDSDTGKKSFNFALDDLREAITNSGERK